MSLLWINKYCKKEMKTFKWLLLLEMFPDLIIIIKLKNITQKSNTVYEFSQNGGCHKESWKTNMTKNSTSKVILHFQKKGRWVGTYSVKTGNDYQSIKE